VRRSRFKLLPLLAFGVYFAYYYFSHQQTVPLTGRTQLVDISREQEAALGYQSYRQILRQSSVVRQGQAYEQVRAIGARLAKVAEDPGFEWEFNLIQSEDVNAFCLPGGKVAVYTGILPASGYR